MNLGHCMTRYLCKRNSNLQNLYTQNYTYEYYAHTYVYICVYIIYVDMCIKIY